MRGFSDGGKLLYSQLFHSFVDLMDRKKKKNYLIFPRRDFNFQPNR